MPSFACVNFHVVAVDDVCLVPRAILASFCIKSVAISRDTYIVSWYVCLEVTITDHSKFLNP